jgi:hypothetical protein
MMRAWITVGMLLPIALPAQEVIFLSNPSFEDRPRHSKPPWGWFDCGKVGETPPDIHPSGYFGVTTPPQHGRSYVGMVVRDNGAWEALGQRLEMPMVPGVCYFFSIHTARSDRYMSYSRLYNSMEPVDYTGAARLRAWGGNQHCDRRELLWESPPVESVEWERHDMVLQPSEAFTHLVMEAFYRDAAEPPYLGNLLLDNASALIPAHCDWPATFSLPLEKLQAPRLESLQALRAYLAAQGQQARLSADGEAWERHLFYDAQGELQQVNQYLWLIGQAVGQFPGCRLEIWLHGRMIKASKKGAVYELWREEDFLMQGRWRTFEQAFMAAGLKPGQYRIRAARRWGKQKAWLWPKKAQPYNLRLIQK